MNYTRILPQEKPSISSLPLQMLFYFNTLYSIVYFMMMLKICIDKYKDYPKDVASLIMIIVWSIFEPIRLYFGIYGNLGESVPHISTFLLLCIFPQIITISYLSFIQIHLYPLDKILGIFMIIFEGLEIILSFLLVRSVIKNQTALFMRLIHQDEHID